MCGTVGNRKLLRSTLGTLKLYRSCTHLIDRIDPARWRCILVGTCARPRPPESFRWDEPLPELLLRALDTPWGVMLTRRTLCRNMAMIYNTAMVMEMSLSNQRASRHKTAEFESLVADLFRRAGWEVLYHPSGRDHGVDIIVDSGDRKYVVVLKRSSEGRRDRLIPLLSQAVLQVQAAKRRSPKSTVSVAVVAADRVPDSVAEQLKEFARQHAPGVAIGIVDREGFRAFQGFGLERFNAEREATPSLGSLPHSGVPVHLFSDLNQWMLKVLLAPRIPEALISAPRERYHSAAQLARAAGVSVMSASRLIRQLSTEGFLDNRRGRLGLVRVETMLERWRGTSNTSVREVSARWIIPGGKTQLQSAVKSYASRMEAKSLRTKHFRGPQRMTSLPRICVGLFGAAEFLGVGFVRGVAPHLYLERVDAAVLKLLGLSLENAERNPDVQIRIPENKESIFRSAVRHAGVPVSDIIQIWLDVANHLARGKEQAEQIWERVLGPALRSERDERSS